MTDITHANSDATARAEVLLWQGAYRIGIALVLAGGSLLLRALSVVSAESYGATRFGVETAALLFLAATVLFVALTALIRWRVHARRQASNALVRTQLAADAVVVHACALLLTPPGQFDRTLIISMFLVQFSQLYFGWRTTLFMLGSVAVSYTTIVAAAANGGMLRSPVEQLWTFALFGSGSLAYAWMLGHQGVRMKRLTHLFERAREGNFDEPYEDGRDKFPDYITQIGRAYNDLRGHLETIILTDPLSGCFNRRGFKQLAAREVSRGIRAKWRVAVLALDVDHFKRINDEFGHLTGDEAIKEIGELIREIARAGDVVARLGGEEFSILAPDTDEAGAMHLSGRILQAFRARAFHSVRGQLPISISIGIASDDASIDDVVRVLTARADEALYVAKRNGRDQGVLWQTGMRAFDTGSSRLSREIERMP
ncbi:MAG: GGDEF domain-containing protein [Gemmatimonadaceae bacterium]|nr:GGDEF domain-containing protein [Gemmatimonadaceae bacterium]